MKVKELIILLNQFKLEADVFVSSDEELNTIYKSFEVAVLGEEGDDKPETEVIIYGLTGSERK